MNNENSNLDTQRNRNSFSPSEFTHGPVPRPPQFGRWLRPEQVDLSKLPTPKPWTCLRTNEKMTIDGRLDEPVWERAAWSEPFTVIDTGNKTPFETRVATLWNEEYLFVGYKVEDHDIRGSMTGFNDHVYILDEDVEIFFEGDGYYYELGINPLNNTYQIRWTWIERLVHEKRFDELERLFMAPDYLYYTSRKGEPIGRHADLNYQLPGFLHAVHIDGALNCPEVKDRGWTVEFALPWAGLKEMAGGRELPPKPGDIFRMVAYRCHHDRKTKSLKGWTTSVMGNDNIHIPERWNPVVFSGETA